MRFLEDFKILAVIIFRLELNFCPGMFYNSTSNQSNNSIQLAFTSSRCRSVYSSYCSVVCFCRRSRDNTQTASDCSHSCACYLERTNTVPDAPAAFSCSILHEVYVTRECLRSINGLITARSCTFVMLSPVITVCGVPHWNSLNQIVDIEGKEIPYATCERSYISLRCFHSKISYRITKSTTRQWNSLAISHHWTTLVFVGIRLLRANSNKPVMCTILPLW